MTTERGWAIKPPNTELPWMCPVFFTKEEAIENFLKDMDSYARWGHWFRRGYRAVRVEIREIEKEGKP